LRIYDLAVVGAGPAGVMAAIRAAQLDKSVVVIEKNAAIGRKLMLSGAGRCNLTNTGDINNFLEAFGQGGKFFRSAFSAFSNDDLITFLREKGLEVKIHEKGRVFPVSEKAASLVELLESCLTQYRVTMLYKSRVAGIRLQGGVFKVKLNDGRVVASHKVVIATGGASYPQTGSCGDGYRLAKRLGHNLETIMPALVPLRVKEKWAKQLQGLSLAGLCLVFLYSKKKIVVKGADLLFTHFGISGPAVLDASNFLVPILAQGRSVTLRLDLKPEITAEATRALLLKEFNLRSKSNLKNFMKTFLPQRAADVLLKTAGFLPEKKINQITRDERLRLFELLKSLTLTITAPLGFEAAMATAGGISRRQIDPRTMESRLVAGLYFAGEIIAGPGLSGGYNIQKAFSTGYLAGSA
jgi:predicted Rossmann fold flavoprotein